MSRLYGQLADRYGWTPEQVSDLTLGQAEVLLGGYDDGAASKHRVMTFTEYRAMLRDRGG